MSPSQSQPLTLREITAHRTPPGSLTLWWLGQTGFIVKSPGGQTLVLDPYLTNSCKAIGESAGFNFDRLVPPPLRPADLAGIGRYVLTHSHQDHLDPDTLAGYRSAGGHGPFLAPPETAEKLQALGVPASAIVMVWPNKTHTQGDLAVRATFAIPLGADDLTHVGYVVAVPGGPGVYFTGDTAYHPVLATAAGASRPDILAAVINGAFSNLSAAEAALLAKELDAKVVIPTHYDLFPDNCQPPQMLHTNLKLLGLGDRYRLLQHGVPFDYVAPRAADQTAR